MGELVAALILAVLGFFIGGIVGMNSEIASWSPYCWYGALIGLSVAVGVPICLHALD